ncbi:hypothetical protein [Sphaerimonospora thailandensis]|uniref:Transposase n=1 Tax=Sphaerimonospora thailandensis TaxID=795644 RepID=A0A8J3W1L1_9ACTN|nr:hypothetical protein [Sphaerimonospora thailandensis]GIH73429.1 hypothetical protein Mth01_56820 [Sphaerimonospora thailandensis]
MDGPRSIAHAAKELGIQETTLGNWVTPAGVRQAHGNDVGPQDAGEKKNERELVLGAGESKASREEVSEKTAAFFAWEHR